MRGERRFRSRSSCWWCSRAPPGVSRAERAGRGRRTQHGDAANALGVPEAGIARAIDSLNGPIVGALPQTLFTGQAFGTAGFTYTVLIANNTVAGAGLIADTGGAANDTDGILVLTS